VSDDLESVGIGVSQVECLLKVKEICIRDLDANACIRFAALHHPRFGMAAQRLLICIIAIVFGFPLGCPIRGQAGFNLRNAWHR
jgi:hypothetical protein